MSRRCPSSEKRSALQRLGVATAFSLLAAAAPAAGVQGGITLAADSTVDSPGARPRAAAPGLPAEERDLLLALDSIVRARLADAERRLRELLRRHPTFHLARVVLADVLVARGGGGVDFASGAAGERVEALRAEALARLTNARAAAHAGDVPEVLLQLSPHQRRVLVVDVSASRLYVYGNVNDRLSLERSYYVATGKNGAAKRREGDQRTPVGVYFVTGRINGASLPDFDGPGALPVNYPNEWDLRNGRTGYGIWIHGVPSDTFARPPRSSDGCMAMSNTYVAELLEFPQMHDTPVIIADGLNWTSLERLHARRRELHAQLETWRRDWESRDVDRYARHYSRSFRSDDLDIGAWMAQKRRVNAGKRFIRVALQDVSMFGYPGERDLVVVSFRQVYTSSNFSNRTRKRQYWQREQDGRWRIVYEGVVRLRSEHLRGIPYSARARLSSR